MELVQGIETRRSCRAFKPTPVPNELVEKVLKAAGKSPSYMNSQPWEVAVVSGEKRNELSRVLYDMAKSGVAFKPDIKGPETWLPALDARIKEHNARRFQSLGIERSDERRKTELRLLNYRFYGAPCVLFLFIDRTLSAWSTFDMGLFAQSLILAAHSFGLGSCLQASAANYPDTIRQFLGIPDTKIIILGIALGYPDTEAPINKYQSFRASLSDFVRWYA